MRIFNNTKDPIFFEEKEKFSKSMYVKASKRSFPRTSAVPKCFFTLPRMGPREFLLRAVDSYLPN